MPLDTQCSHNVKPTFDCCWFFGEWVYNVDQMLHQRLIIGGSLAFGYPTLVKNLAHIICRRWSNISDDIDQRKACYLYACVSAFVMVEYDDYKNDIK